LHNGEDRDLQRLFRTLRDEERDTVPQFETLMARAKEEAARSGMEAPALKRARHLTARRLAWGGGLLAAAAAAVLILLPPRGTSEAEFVQVVQMFSADPASGAWRSPTDGLLDLPGNEVLSTVPSIGSRRWLLDSNTHSRRNEL
jgi:hypothetical protein